MECQLVHYHVRVRLDDNSEPIQMLFELNEREPASVICKNVAGCLGQSGKCIDPSDLILTVQRKGIYKRLAPSDWVLESDRGCLVAWGSDSRNHDWEWMVVNSTDTSHVFQVGGHDPAGIICEQVATYLCEELGKRIAPSQVCLTVAREGASKYIALSNPVLEDDLAHMVAYVDAHMESRWEMLVADWDDSDLRRFIYECAVRPLDVTQRKWSDTGEFGEIVRLIDEMFQSMTNLRDTQDLTPTDIVQAVQAAGATSDSPAMVLRVLNDHITEMTTRTVPIVNADGQVLRERAVHANSEETVSSCIEKLAEQEDVDPSMIRLRADGAHPSYLDAPPKGTEAFVSEESWRDLVVHWRRSDRPQVNRIADFIDELSQRLMPETRDGTWGTAGEFGELVRSIGSLLNTEQRRGGPSGVEDIDEIFDVLKSCTGDLEASPKTVKAFFNEEFG